MYEKHRYRGRPLKPSRPGVPEKWKYFKACSDEHARARLHEMTGLHWTEAELEALDDDFKVWHEIN